MVGDERSCCCCRDCGCGCNDDDVTKTSSTRRILGATNNSIDLYVSTPAKTKWIFVEEVDNERATAE